MKEQILNLILTETFRESMEDISTAEIAKRFNITTAKAYKICSDLANEKLITKLDPVNGDKFSCCGWIRNHDNDNK